MVVFFLFVASNLFLNSFGQNAIVSLANECYNVGDTLTLTAEYTGSGDPSLVQWYFSGVPAERFRLQTSNCGIFGSIPVGFPDANRLDYSCSLSDNTYKLEVTDLQAAEVNASWGATFNPPAGAVPAPVQEAIVECTSSTSTPTTSTFPAASTTGSATSPPNVTDSDGKKIIIGVSVGVVIAVVLAILIGVCCYFKYKNEERKQEHSENKVSYSNNQGQDVQHGRFSNKSYETENRF